jgi:endonuclease YncB( thermonuclease family)
VYHWLLIFLVIASTVFAEPISRKSIEVTNGDTIRANGETYSLLGYDAPETVYAKCPAERALGNRATARLQAIINFGELDLTEIPCPCLPGTQGTRWCSLGPRCAVLTARGEHVGKVLIREGLAKPLQCGKFGCQRPMSWC